MTLTWLPGFIKSAGQTLEISFKLRLSELSYNTKIKKKKNKGKMLPDNCHTDSLQQRLTSLPSLETGQQIFAGWRPLSPAGGALCRNNF